MVALKQIRDRPMMSRPNRVLSVPSARISSRAGTASRISAAEPVRATARRPTRSESHPSTGISARHTAMTMICRIWEVSSETAPRPPCMLAMIAM